MSPTVALSEAAIHRGALEQLAPPSMLVDEAHRVVHLSENAGRSVMPSGGPLSGDVVDLVRPELRFELRSALAPRLRADLADAEPADPGALSTARRIGSICMVKPVPENGADQRAAVVMFIEGEEVDETLKLPPNVRRSRRDGAAVDAGTAN